MIKNQKIVVLILFFLLNQVLFSQTTDSIPVEIPILKNNNSKARKIFVWSGTSICVVGTHAMLYKTWYGKNNNIKFHWTNDNHEWFQMDKFGHAWSAAIETKIVYKSFVWAGYSNKKSAVIGCATSLIFQSAIEYFDGISPTWGASWGDLVANASGTTFTGAQYFVWGKVKVPLRFSFRNSHYAKLRPNFFGRTLPQRMLKDYNGQAYWLDFSPVRMGLKTGTYPSWLGVQFGIGAQGMMGGYSNVFVDKNGHIKDFSHVPRYRQWYIAPSINLSKIYTKKKLLKIVFFITEHVRIPIPTLEYNKVQGFVFHALY